MALTLNQIVGFETGGLEEATSGTGGSPDANEATIVNPGGSERSLKFSGIAGQTYDGLLFSEVANAGNAHITGFAIRFDAGVTPSALSPFFYAMEGGLPSSAISLWLDTNGNVLVVDANSTTVANGAITTPFTANAWHYVELYFQNSASGAWELSVDGVSVGSGSGEDFTDGNTLDEFRFQGNSAYDGPMYVDDFYWLSGAISSADRLGSGFHVRGFQSGAGSVSDTGSNAQSAWSNTGERPSNDSNFINIWGKGAVIFNDANSGGAGPGPASASGSLPASDSEIVGAKFWHRLRRGTGQDRTHGRYYGNSGDGVGAFDTTPDATITTSFQNYFVVTQDPTKVPLTTEDFYMGAGKDETNFTGQDANCAEMMGMLAWVTAPASAPVTPLVPQMVIM